MGLPSVSPPIKDWFGFIAWFGGGDEVAPYNSSVPILSPIPTEGQRSPASFERSLPRPWRLRNRSEQQAREKGRQSNSPRRRTGGSNPSPSSGESDANPSRCLWEARHSHDIFQIRGCRRPPTLRQRRNARPFDRHRAAKKAVGASGQSNPCGPPGQKLKPPLQVINPAAHLENVG